MRAEHVEVPRVSTLYFNGLLIQSDEQARLAGDLYEGFYTATAVYVHCTSEVWNKPGNFC
jgi:hypothetical protein